MCVQRTCYEQVQKVFAELLMDQGVPNFLHNIHIVDLVPLADACGFCFFVTDSFKGKSNFSFRKQTTSYH